MGGRLRVRRVGSFGVLTSEIATALAMVLTELLQNAVEHGYPDGADDGEVVVGVVREPGLLRFEVVDDGRGLPPDRPDRAATLGLSIVGTLVESELGGQLELGPAPGGRGTRARIDIPLEA
jgi:two-component sensor histidine kinase